MQHKGSDLDDLTAHPSSTATVATKSYLVQVLKREQKGTSKVA